eukprot:TRINITY_DN905_c0_g6_i1.p1 TRINITY_DN905_c0_g6~~TRINITY_DN905_c0_g6_i1.p1  ORF type:complete len:439 (+),score=105.36 TRINITY_DN905_c0_g6_i1:132-1448(+)
MANKRKLATMLRFALLFTVFFIVVFLLLHYRTSLPSAADPYTLVSTNRDTLGIESKLSSLNTQKSQDLEVREKELREYSASLQEREKILRDREEATRKKDKALRERSSGRFGSDGTLKTVVRAIKSISENASIVAAQPQRTIPKPKRDTPRKKIATSPDKQPNLLDTVVIHTPVGTGRFAIISAYKGQLYEPMGIIADLTKEKYADLQGYDYYSDPSLFKPDMTWNEKSAIRLNLYRKYLPNYEWVFWTDSDVLIVNPTIQLENIVDDDHDAVMSKDWGGRQVNPGSMLLRNSEGGWALLDAWQEFLADDESGHDDLRAFSLLCEKRPELEQRVKWVPQRTINAYPHMGMRDKSYDFILNPDHGHDLWSPGDFVVHIVDCLRDYGTKDPMCCSGLAAWYYKEFEYAWRKASGHLLYASPENGDVMIPPGGRKAYTVKV